MGGERGWKIRRKPGRFSEKGEALARQLPGTDEFHVTTELTLQKIGHRRVGAVGPPGATLRK